MSPCFSAIVLAAGLSRRMGGGNKLLALVDGAPLIARAVEAACGSRAERVVLVAGADAEALRAAAGAHKKLYLARNLDTSRGMASSLRLGLEAVGACDAAAILLGDMPDIDARLVDALFAAWTPLCYACAPTYRGIMGNPVVLGRAAMAACARLEGDQGARALLRAHLAQVVQAPVETPGVLRDLDTPDDFEAWRTRASIPRE